jgi:hypothetical protein
MSIVRGPYRATWNGLNIGNTEIGFRKAYSYQGRNIAFDAVGDVNVDVLLGGINMTIDFVAQEYDAEAIESLRWPWHSIPGSMYPAGQSMWMLAKPLILTACLSTTDPATITFYKTILAPGFDVEINYAHIERPVPLRLMAFPIAYDAGSGYANPEMPSGCTEMVYYDETLQP